MHCTRRESLAAIAALVWFRPRLAAAWDGSASFALDDGKSLLDAVRSGALDKVGALLAQDPLLARTKDELGRSALVLAYMHGHETIAKALLATGLELDLVEAVLAEDWPRMDALAKQASNSVDALHPIGGAPLYAAALVGSLDAWRVRGIGCAPEAQPKGGAGGTPARGALRSPRAEWAFIGLTDLLSNGADINAAQDDGTTILHATVERKDERLLRLAIRKGAKIDVQDRHGRTPATLAEEIGWSAGAALLKNAASLPRDHRASRFALDAHRQLVVRPDLSDVPQALQSQVTGASHANLRRLRELTQADPRLIFSISTEDELAIEACAHVGQRDIIRYHLDHGAPHALPTAVALGDLETVKFYLTKDRKLIHERGAHDFPVLWYAVLGNSGVEMMELLLSFGVEVGQESMGGTALHWCARRGTRDMAAYLIERGADLEAVSYRWDRQGQTPFQVALKDKRSEMVQLLRDAGAKR